MAVDAPQFERPLDVQPSDCVECILNIQTDRNAHVIPVAHLKGKLPEKDTHVVRGEAPSEAILGIREAIHHVHLLLYPLGRQTLQHLPYVSRSLTSHVNLCCRALIPGARCLRNLSPHRFDLRGVSNHFDEQTTGSGLPHAHYVVTNYLHICSTLDLTGEGREVLPADVDHDSWGAGIQLLRPRLGMATIPRWGTTSGCRGSSVGLKSPPLSPYNLTSLQWRWYQALRLGGGSSMLL